MTSHSVQVLLQFRSMSQPVSVTLSPRQLRELEQKSLREFRSGGELIYHPRVEFGRALVTERVPMLTHSLS